MVLKRHQRAIGQPARALAATWRSLTSPEYAASRSWARSTADGWMVASANEEAGAPSSSWAKDSGSRADAGHGRSTPRDLVTRKDGPNSDFAAVAPSATTTSGSSTANSATSHGRHAPTSAASGVAWVSPFPRPPGGEFEGFSPLGGWGLVG